MGRETTENKRREKEMFSVPGVGNSTVNETDQLLPSQSSQQCADVWSMGEKNRHTGTYLTMEEVP